LVPISEFHLIILYNIQLQNQIIFKYQNNETIIYFIISFLSNY